MVKLVHRRKSPIMAMVLQSSNKKSTILGQEVAERVLEDVNVTHTHKICDTQGRL